MLYDEPRFCPLEPSICWPLKAATPWLTRTIWLGSVAINGVLWVSTFTFGIAASALALVSNHVVNTTIRPATTMPIVAAITKPKIPAAIAPREASVGSEMGLLRAWRRPWLAAATSSNVPSIGRTNAKRFAMLLMTSGSNIHCHPPKGPVNAGSET